MNILNKLERKWGRYAIRDLMKYVCILNVVGLIPSFMDPYFFYKYLALDPAAILHGQVWRLVTFLMQPDSTGTFGQVLLSLLMIFIYYNIGSTLENLWGSFRFNLYYISGMVFTIIASFLVYGIYHVSFPMGNSYLNLSLFFAIAIMFPDTQFMIGFLFPIKAKWLGIVYAVLLTASLIGGNAATRILILGSVLNVIIFFIASRGTQTVQQAKQKKRKAEFSRELKPNAKGARHKCVVCGRTELSNPELEFRYCSKCEGEAEYCQDHLYTHTHITHERNI